MSRNPKPPALAGGVFTNCLTILATLLALLTSTVQAKDFSTLKGYWQCQEEGVEYGLDFTSASERSYNGQPTRYQLGQNMILVQEEYGPVGYYYQVAQGTLIIMSPDGHISHCQRGTKPKIASSSKSQNVKGSIARSTEESGSLIPGQNWPRSTRPVGTVAWNSEDPQALLYKFAGRWDRVSTNTLSNLYLKPDGSYEEAYEASYSGTFSDQGGYQTGAWGTAGSEQASGQWMIEGSLEEGVLTLISRNGGQTRLNYRVHVENGEYYGGEYFFNGQLYSVEYIYR